MANRNEGEGNRTAAKEYNTAQQAFIRAGKVPPAAERAKQAINSAEKIELEKAEAIGRKPAAPTEKKSADY